MPVCPVCDGFSALGLLLCGYCGCTGETNDEDYFYNKQIEESTLKCIKYEDWIFEDKNLNKKEEKHE